MEKSNISGQPRTHRGINAGYESLAKINEDGTYELSVLVDGVHCAGCIQKIESVLGKEKDIHNARLNFSTHRLSLIWNGDRLNANDYIHIVESLGYNVQPYDPEAERDKTRSEERFLLLCLGVAGFAMGNVMLLSVAVWSSSAENMGVATRDLMHWASALIALPTILFSGRPFFRSAFNALSAGHTNMDVPISLALFLAGGMSLFETIHHGEHVYFDSAVMLMFFLLVGKYLDFRARKNARSTAADLLGTLSGFAKIVEGKKVRHIPVRDVVPNMIVRVNAGEKFPVDGMVIEGNSSIDVSLVTGESLPQKTKTGDQIFAGTINLSHPLTVQVVKAAENSLLSDIIRLMEKAGQGQAKYVRLADKAARLYTPVVHICAALAFLGWWLVGGLAWQPSLMIAVTVLIITCPCALGLAVPVVQVLATERLMKNSVLVKSGDALERLARVDTVLLDKTGTLTLGRLQIIAGQYEERDLNIAASLAAYSTHPLSKALPSPGNIVPIEKIKEYPGQGIQGIYNGKRIRLGSREWCGDQKQDDSSMPEIWLNIEGKAPIPFYFKDQLREDSAQTIRKLQKAGLALMMLSGDRQSVAENIAEMARIENIYAEKKPTEKFEILEYIKNQNHTVLMVGDGLNDAPVLAGADVSMAPGTAIDIAQNAADIVFMGDRFAPVYDTYITACITQKLVQQNFMLAVVYNMIAVPLALAGMVTPLIAAIAMSGSSLVVIANSFRLRLHA